MNVSSYLPTRVKKHADCVVDWWWRATGNAEFQSMENLSEPQRMTFSQQYSELSAKTMQIKISEKVHVMFHINDKIFTRTAKIDDDELEQLEEWSRCNCCGDQEKIRKLKNW